MFNRKKNDFDNSINQENYSDGLTPAMVNILKGNPFAYDAKKNEFNLTSVEDFYIKINRKQTMPFGAVLRGDDFKVGKRNSLIMKTIKFWKNDFEKTKDKLIKNELDKTNIAGDVVPDKVGIGKLIISILSFIVVAFFTFRSGIFWTKFIDKAWFAKVIGGINTAYSRNWFVMVANASLYLTILSFIYGCFQNMVIKDYVMLVKIKDKAIEKTKEKIQNCFKKKYKITYKYYKKAIHKKYINVEPLSIDKTGNDSIDFNDIASLSDSYMKKTFKMKKAKGILKFFNFVIFYLSSLGVATVVGDIIYEVVLNFIKGISA